MSVGIYGDKNPTNWAWLFTPEGALTASYQKHHMAPPERHERYSSGTDYSVVTIDGETYGLAICKDMHFAAFGRAYGERHAAVMLVPAWDFDYLDGWMASRTTTMRGVENGYTIIRASREGLLTVSDAYGRILAETQEQRDAGQLPAGKSCRRRSCADSLHAHREFVRVDLRGCGGCVSLDWPQTGERQKPVASEQRKLFIKNKLWRKRRDSNP